MKICTALRKIQGCKHSNIQIILCWPKQSVTIDNFHFWRGGGGGLKKNEDVYSFGETLQKLYTTELIISSLVLT